MKKSVIQTYRAVVVRVKARRAWKLWEESGPCALSPGWASLTGSEVGVGGGGGASTGDCEIGRVSVCLRGSSNRGSGGMGQHAGQQRQCGGVSGTPGNSPPTEPHTWLMRPPFPSQPWTFLSFASVTSSAGVIERGRVIECQGGRGVGCKGWRSGIGKSPRVTAIQG